MTQISVAVIGSGYWGKNLVRVFGQLGALKVVCDRNGDVAENFGKALPGVQTCMSAVEAISRPDVDAVVVATPAETHASLVRQALSAGKHVFVEKPMALDVAEAAELEALARSRGLTLMVGHLLQYHPMYVRLKQMALDGDLGKINYIYSNRLNLGKIRREENILWSFAPHDISMILGLVGEDPLTVSVTGGTFLSSGVADVTVSVMEFPNKVMAHVFVSWLHPFKEQKLVVVGDRQMAVFDDTLPWGEKLQIFPHEIKWHGSMPVPTKASPVLVDVPQDEPLLLECRHFLECVAAGRRPLTDGVEGLRVLRVLNAAQKSLDTQGAAVRLDSLDKPAGDFFVHPTAVVDAGARIGAGSKIWHFSHVLPGSVLGEGCNVGQNVVIGPDAQVGRGVKIQNNVSVYKGVTLEDDVFCGPSMVFTNVLNPRAFVSRMHELRPTLVRKGASLGANCTVVCGRTVGRYAFVGAGAVVASDVPDHALVVGNPARRVGWMCACGERLGEDLACQACGSAYRETPDGLVPLAD
ncbi:Gfo/Idh/MocA family oxidoreductase [Fundidesulfovibrio butyratiphilus]